ncbi:hypothetical protein ACS0TY_012527 [Phlomoides rotata]
MPGIAFGRVDDSFSAASIKAYIAGFISTLLFVVGSAIAYKKLTSAALDPAGLMAIAVCHGLALFVAIAIAGNISGGHVNPAVTFDLAVGGQITILTGLFYWIAQLLGAIVASFLLKVVTGGLRSPWKKIASTMLCTRADKSAALGSSVLTIVVQFSHPYEPPAYVTPEILNQH